MENLNHTHRCLNDLFSFPKHSHTKETSLLTKLKGKLPLLKPVTSQNEQIIADVA